MKASKKRGWVKFDRIINQNLRDYTLKDEYPVDFSDHVQTKDISTFVEKEQKDKITILENSTVTICKDSWCHFSLNQFYPE